MFQLKHLKQFPFPRDSSLATSWHSSRSIVLIGCLSWNANQYQSEKPILTLKSFHDPKPKLKKDVQSYSPLLP